MLVPVAIATLTAAAYVAQSRRKPKEISAKARAERRVIFETLINEVKDPEVLRQFADAFRHEGNPVEADMLLKRAQLRELPPDVKNARRDAFKKGMASKDPVAIRKLADAFEQTGATGAAGALRDAALALERAQQQQIVEDPDIAAAASNPGIEPTAQV